MRYAFVVDGLVVELIAGDADLSAYHPDFAAALHEAGDDVAIGWTFAAGDFSPPAPVAVQPGDLVAYARDARWRAEVAGLVWNDVPIATDDSSKLKIAGARLAAQANPAFETTWYGTDGEGVVVDTPLIIELSDAVLAHVDGTFRTFGQVKAAIAAGTITTREEVDAAFAGEA